MTALSTTIETEPMAPRVLRHRPRRPADGAPPPGALLELAADTATVDALAAPPPGVTVTASFSSPATARAHGSALTTRGYVVVGGPAQLEQLPGGPARLHLLVLEGDLAGHPSWARVLLGQARRVYHLSHGPAAALLAGVLRPHLAARH